MEPVTTIDPADAGAGAASATTPSTMPARVIGAVVGAIAGIVAIGGLYAIARVTGLGDWVGLALLVGEDGVFSMSSGMPLAWAVPPIAAAVVGAVTAPAAARGVRWSGWWMGFLTYFLAIVLGAVVLVFAPTGILGTTTDVGVDPLSLVVGMFALAFIGAIVAAPLLVLCVTAGVAWAAIVRRVAPAPAGPAGPGSRPIIVLGVVAGVLAVLWVMVTTLLDILVASQTGG